MAVEIRVPTLGESVTEATIGQWFKKVGDAVAADEPVVELETDKVTIEVPAPSAGVLESIVANPGDTVNVGALIGAIGDGAGVTVTPKATAPAAAVAAPAPKLEAAAPVVVLARSNGSAVPAAPSAQKLMAESGLSDGDVAGSGRRGQVLKEDVLATLSRPAVAPQVTTVPLRARTFSKASSMVPPTCSTMISTPRLLVYLRICAVQSGSAASTTNSAPTLWANARFSGVEPVETTRAPRCLAI